MQNQMFKLGSSDVVKGIIMAAISGFALPVLAAIQTPGFDIATVDWHSVLVLAVNGAIAGFGSYIVKNFFSDQEGRLFGKIG